MRKLEWFRCVGILAFCLWLFPSFTFAASARRVVSFQSQVVTEGRQSFLRIEIGMNGPIKDYTVKGDSILHPNRLTVEIDKAEKETFGPRYRWIASLQRRFVFRNREKSCAWRLRCKCLRQSKTIACIPWRKIVMPESRIG